MPTSDHVWRIIEALYCRGYALEEIRRVLHGAPAASNICRRAQREGWIQPVKKPHGTRIDRSRIQSMVTAHFAGKEAIADAAEVLQNPPLRGRHAPGQSAKRTLPRVDIFDNPELSDDNFDDRMVQVIESLKEGATFRLAAALAGVNENTVLKWRHDSPSFEKACRQAKAYFATSKIKVINEHALEDWRAASWLLSNHPETRNDFHAKETQRGPGALQVILQIPRSSDEAKLIQAQIIEGEAFQKNAPDEPGQGLLADQEGESD